MKLSFSERIHERIAALFPAPAALDPLAPVAPAKAAEAAEVPGAASTGPGTAGDDGATAGPDAPGPLAARVETPLGTYDFDRADDDGGWHLRRDGVEIMGGAAAGAVALAYHQDLAERLQALMATHAAVAALSGTISGREPGGRRWSLDVTGDGLLRMIALGLREPGL
ncbi:hypothetical protein [Frigidibacter sp. MR17.24]|uniref:hypothetical protein n=1 Tax=Frigidibacter sp. MR17.24 TaxID=3127345 RepID=UPI003012EE45